MRKIVLLMAILLPFFTLNVGAEDKVVVKEIPLQKVENGVGERSLDPLCIKSLYNGIFEAIQTYVSSDLGLIEITVLNCLTGEMWTEVFDSSTISSHLIYISNESGIYEITYTSQNGDVYQGSLNI